MYPDSVKMIDITSGYEREDLLLEGLDFTGGERRLYGKPAFMVPKFKRVPLDILEKELKKAGELGPVAIGETIEGLKASHVYKVRKGKSSATK